MQRNLIAGYAACRVTPGNLSRGDGDFLFLGKRTVYLNFFVHIGRGGRILKRPYLVSIGLAGGQFFVAVTDVGGIFDGLDLDPVPVNLISVTLVYLVPEHGSRGGGVGVERAKFDLSQRRTKLFVFGALKTGNLIPAAEIGIF